MHLDEPAKKRARSLRRDSSFPEKRLWSILRDRRLAGLKFRRQFPILPYFADYCCVEHHLVVELDGPTHEGREKQDAARMSYPNRQGFRVIRFLNDDVLENVEAVGKAILLAVGIDPHTCERQNNPSP